MLRCAATPLPLGQSFAQSRPVDISLKDVTTAQALDYLFLQEGLFFQKLSRRTILVADQARRPQYQQLVLRTFFLSNMKPADARQLVQQAIPPSVGRPQTIVVPDDATNSLTVRDTAENVRLIGDLLQSIDKDRAEVVMDVSIYEVSKSDLMQFGNQIGTPGSNGVFSIGGSPGFSLLTDNGIVNSGAGRGVNLGANVGKREIDEVQWFPSDHLPDLQFETSHALVTLARSARSPQARPLS